MKKTFENWLWEEVESCFDIQKTTSNPILTEWESTTIVLDTTWKDTLKKLQNLLENHYQDWNEEELKLNFIAPLLSLVNYYENNFLYQPFAERVIKAEINDWELSGIIDWLLASGKQIPKQPFFFFCRSTNAPKWAMLTH